MPAALQPKKNPKDRNPDAHPADEPDGAAPHGSAPASGGDSRGGGAPGDAETLRQQLQAKEQLVHALTERLEQAAEQLDRFRRTGADKGRRPVGGGMPAELVEQQRSTLDDLKRVIERWEDIQAGAALGRIETQIIELRSLVAGAVQSGGGIVASPSSHHAPPAHPSPAASTDATAKPGSGSWWEAQKAAMLGDAPPPPPLESTSAHDEPEESSQPHERVATPGEFDMPEPPAPVDFESLTLEEAQKAIRDRDDVITRLRDPLILMQTSGQLPDGLPSLESAPEPLRAKLLEIEKQWQAKFRQAELDLSLERARLAREQSTVRQQQDQIQKELRRLGLGGEKPGEPAKNRDDTSKHRWFRFMNKASEGDSQGDHSGDADV